MRPHRDWPRKSRNARKYRPIWPRPTLNLIGGLGLVLKHPLGAGIEITLDIADTLPSVLADQGQLETVPINLATNARDAMPTRGTITFSAISEEVADRGHSEGLVPGAYVAVVNPGSGIAAETLKRIMEPFFTTKPQGKGTGLGCPWPAALPSGQAAHWGSAASQDVAPRW